MVLILFNSYKQIFSYDRAKLKKVDNFYVLTWLIFAGPVTISKFNLNITQLYDKMNVIIIYTAIVNSSTTATTLLSPRPTQPVPSNVIQSTAINGPKITTLIAIKSMEPTTTTLLSPRPTQPVPSNVIQSTAINGPKITTLIAIKSMEPTTTVSNTPTPASKDLEQGT